MPELSDFFTLFSSACSIDPAAGKRRLETPDFPSETLEASRTDPWTDFVDAFGSTIHSIVRRTLFDFGWQVQTDDVLDIQQEVYCRLLRRAARGATLRAGGDGAAREYIERVVAAVIVDRVRRRGCRKRQCVGLRSTGTLSLDRHESPEVNPEERMLVVERVDWVVARCREVAGQRGNRRLKMHALLLVVLADYRSQEVVDALNGRITVSHVDTLVSRLRGRMAAEGFELPRRNAAELCRRSFGAQRAPRLLARAA